MRMLRNILIDVVVVALAGRIYLGWFNKIVPVEKTVGPYIVAYVKFTGPYKDVSPSMDALQKQLSWAGIVQTAGIGIYYDDPATVEAKELKSEVGSIIDQKDLQKVVAKASGYRVKILEAKNRVVIEFPLKNALSSFIGPRRVYPVMNAYLQSKWYSTKNPKIEIYDTTAKKIYFIADIVK